MREIRGVFGGSAQRSRRGTLCAQHFVHAQRPSSVESRWWLLAHNGTMTPARGSGETGRSAFVPSRAFPLPVRVSTREDRGMIRKSYPWLMFLVGVAFGLIVSNRLILRAQAQRQPVRAAPGGPPAGDDLPVSKRIDSPAGVVDQPTNPPPAGGRRAPRRSMMFSCDPITSRFHARRHCCKSATTSNRRSKCRSYSTSPRWSVRKSSRRIPSSSSSRVSGSKRV